MHQYKELVRKIYHTGTFKGDRTGTGTTSIFGYQMRFDLQKGFPLVTLKQTSFKMILTELLWFLRGDTNIKFLNDHNCRIWDEWANDEGELGPVYGEMWRSWPSRDCEDGTIDQITDVINQIKQNPDSRRLIVSAWNPDLLPSPAPHIKPHENPQFGLQALAPCHTLFQFYVLEGKLSCQLYQRSADIGLGIPYNIASYALLTHMIAQVCNLEVGEFIHTLGDAHLYTNHIKGIEELLTRDPFPLPTLKIDPNVKNIDDFDFEHFEIINYKCHPKISFDIAV